MLLLDTFENILFVNTKFIKKNYKEKTISVGVWGAQTVQIKGLF